MSDIFVASASRTPFGSFGGCLSTVPAPQMASQVIQFILSETGLPAEEIDEAFAAVPLVAIKQLQIDPEKVNVNGGAVSIGHPIGASGGRLAATLVRELNQRKARYGVASLCIGGGEAVATLFENV